MPEDRFVLSRRAAEALAPLLRAGTRLGSRPRKILDAAGLDHRPLFLEARVGMVEVIEEGETTREKHVQIYVGPSTVSQNSIRINGRAAPLDLESASVDDAGWVDLGAADDIAAVWLVPAELPPQTPQTYDPATNWAATGIRYVFDADGSALAPHAVPDHAVGADWARWLHPLLVCIVDNGRVLQSTIGGIDISIEVADSEGARSNPPASGEYNSTEQFDRRSLGLYGFRGENRLDPVNLIDNPGTDIVVRRTNPGTGAPLAAWIAYVSFAEVIDYLKAIMGNDVVQWIRDHLDEVMSMLSDFVDANDGPFWRTGGDESTCNGSAIGDLAKTIVIDLLNLELVGDWTAKPANGGTFRVDGALDVTGDTTMDGDVTVQGQGDFAAGLDTMGNLDVDGDATVGGDVAVTGNISAAVANVAEVNTTGDVTVGANLAVTGSASVGGNLTVTGQLSGGSLKINGNVYVPAQITYTDGNGNPQTITVLKQQ